MIMYDTCTRGIYIASWQWYRSCTRCYSKTGNASQKVVKLGVGILRLIFALTNATFGKVSVAGRNIKYMWLTIIAGGVG
jgi:hypothetical protein